ncbi:unnamed protein product [Nippostrongylus brasiliensis]|uniref:Hydrophobic surface binding protein A-domain-containing protein n=1 Tax=Nippostrongylus brasiliensis TaxID=27835 RepID=A0A0N4YD84_NIPBR|nr:unnamed protein product [Nippostrongylus brasiliensis]
MFSVRLFIAVAGVLLMADANQPEATTRQGRLINLQSQPFLVAAWNENENASSIIDGYLTSGDPNADFLLESTKYSLLLVQRDLNNLLEGTAKDRSGTLLSALGYEIFAYFLPGHCKGDQARCDEVSVHLQRATGKIIAAFFRELTEEHKDKVIKIKAIINGNISENGDIEGEASVQQTKEVAKAVQFALY